MTDRTLLSALRFISRFTFPPPSLSIRRYFSPPPSLPPRSSILLDRVSTYPLFSANEKKQRKKEKRNARVVSTVRKSTDQSRIGEKGLREKNLTISFHKPFRARHARFKRTSPWWDHHHRACVCARLAKVQYVRSLKKGKKK